mmetsp:Transcript_25723/g.46466  ORF Transcript_25723/g.46466 Transcript_25723/m.46466 type:complete len:86 (+) Transcript_25723:1626-1883(+)
MGAGREFHPLHAYLPCNQTESPCILPTMAFNPQFPVCFLCAVLAASAPTEPERWSQRMDKGQTAAAQDQSSQLTNLVQRSPVLDG